MDAKVYCYCSKCPPHKLWQRRTVLIHLQEDNKRLHDPELGHSDLDELRLKLCIEFTGNSLLGMPLGQGMVPLLLFISFPIYDYMTRSIQTTRTTADPGWSLATYCIPTYQ